MSIGAMQKTTLLDYPGAVACTLFWQGCNLRCPVPLPTICSPLWTGSTTTGLAWRPFSEPCRRNQNALEGVQFNHPFQSIFLNYDSAGAAFLRERGSLIFCITPIS